MTTMARLRPRPLLWDTSCPPHLAAAQLVLRWVHSGSRWRARIAYALLIWHVIGFFVLAVAEPALADPTTTTTNSGASSTNSSSDAPPPSPADTSMFGWIDVKDSSGIPVSAYFIAVDQGNALSVIPGVNSDKKANIALAPILELEYGLFKITCQIALWVIGYGLSFKWMDFIARPFAMLGDATGNLTHNIGILALALALAGGVAAFWVVRGHMSKAAYQIGSAIVITALMAGLFAHPISALVGSDGYLAKARDVGISISSGITHGAAASPAGDQPSINELQTSLADGFVRRPTQILNFNAQADANGCKGVWDSGIRSGDRNKLKDTIEKCGTAGKRMKYAADHLTGDRLASAGFMLLLAAILLAFGCYLIGKIVLAVVIALSNAIMLPIVGTLGVVAGGLQGTAFKCLSNIAIAVIKIPLTVIYAGAYAALLGNMLDVKGNPIQVLLLSAVLLIVAVFAFRRIEAGLKNSHGNILSFLNRGGGSAELPKPPPSTLARRGTALAMQAGGAALGVPPSLTGLAIGAGRAARHRLRGTGRGAHLAATRSHNQQQQQQAAAQYQHDANQWWHHQASQWWQAQQDPTSAQHQQPITPDGSAAPIPTSPPQPAPDSQSPPPPRVTEYIREAPPMHPHVAAAVGAMPQQMQTAASLPAVNLSSRAARPTTTPLRRTRPPMPRSTAAFSAPPSQPPATQLPQQPAPTPPAPEPRRSQAADIVNNTPRPPQWRNNWPWTDPPPR